MQAPKRNCAHRDLQAETSTCNAPETTIYIITDSKTNSLRANTKDNFADKGSRAETSTRSALEMEAHRPSATYYLKKSFACKHQTKDVSHHDRIAPQSAHVYPSSFPPSIHPIHPSKHPSSHHHSSIHTVPSFSPSPVLPSP